MITGVIADDLGGSGSVLNDQVGGLFSSATSTGIVVGVSSTPLPTLYSTDTPVPEETPKPTPDAPTPLPTPRPSISTSEPTTILVTFPPSQASAIGESPLLLSLLLLLVVFTIV